MERVDKCISHLGEYSRKEIKQMIRCGEVAVNGEVISDGGFKIDAEGSTVTLRGMPLSLRKHSYLMMNKPQGVLSASRDPLQKTVLDLVPPTLRRKGMFPAGRLDKDTVGLLLITNDGEFAHNILSPRKHVAKTYEATLDGPLDPRAIPLFAQGLQTRDGTSFEPAVLRVLDAERFVAEVILTEGKYHQVKRMFAAVGRSILLLKRTKIGALQLDENLAQGECREISAAELSLVSSLYGRQEENNAG